MGAKIIDRGRGPEIEGTRITVYDVMDYLQEGWRYDQIAGLFRLPPDDIQAAIQYIESHYAEVMADYQQILILQRDFIPTTEAARPVVFDARDKPHNCAVGDKTTLPRPTRDRIPVWATLPSTANTPAAPSNHSRFF